MRTFAIGDIHGCHTALLALLEAVQLRQDDRVILLGDYIDRGPASRQVIETLLGLRDSCRAVFLRGNHEAMMLSARGDLLKTELWQSCGGAALLVSYGAEGREDWAAAIPPAHWEFIDQTVRYFETDTHIFVHACLDPKLDLAEQRDAVLYWNFFDRLRPHKSGKTIICGHTPQDTGKPNDAGFAICIDTDVVCGRWLTCLDVGSRKYWQAKDGGDIRLESL